MHYLITGGNGFIGTNLTLRLLEEGHQVTVLDNFLTSPSDRLRDTRAAVIYGDVTDQQLVFTLAEKCDYIIHLAAVVGVRLAMANGIEGLKVSYEGTQNVLQAAKTYDLGVFVGSSSAIYGKLTNDVVNENDDCMIGSSKKSCWVYSIAKLTEEHLAFSYYRELGTKIKLGRFFNVIGPYQTGGYGMVVPTFINQALDNKSMIVYGTGQQTRTFSYIDDVLDALELILELGDIGDVYNIGATGEISILSLAQKIKQLTDSSSPIEIIPYHEAFDESYEETAQRAPDISKISQLGYTARYSIDEALLSIISFEKSHRQQVPLADNSTQL